MIALMCSSEFETCRETYRICDPKGPFTPSLLGDNIRPLKPWLVALLFAVACLLNAQDVEALTPARLAKVDVVVVGKLYGDFRFPWIGGWNERGHVQVDRVLKGDIGDAQSLPFAWERDFYQGWCLTRPDWRAATGKPGIWLLSHDVFIGFLDPGKHLDQVLRVLAEIRR